MARYEVPIGETFKRRRELAGGTLGMMVAAALVYDNKGDVGHVLIDDRKLVLVPVKPTRTTRKKTKARKG